MLLLLAVTALVTLLLYVCWKLSYWQRQGVRTPGLLYQWACYTRDLASLDQELHLKLGPIYGVYDGLTPTLVLADPQLIPQVLVSEFTKFPNHYPFRLGDPHVDNILSGMEGNEDWKRVRAVISPSFTTAKFRSMKPHVDSSLQKLVKHLEEAARSVESVPVLQKMKFFSFDSLLRCAYGVEIDTYTDRDHPFSRSLDGVFSDQAASIFTMNFPLLARLFGIQKKALRPFHFFLKLAEDILAERSGTGGRPQNDLLQFLLDAGQKRWEGVGGGRSLSDAEIRTQSLSFLLAGYQTKAVALGCAIYQLATQPEVQHKLHQEVSAVDPLLLTESPEELPYLEAFVKELLRINSPIMRVERQCIVEHQLGPVTILPGTTVSIPTYPLHLDPQYFPDPKAFKPERFLEKGSEEGYTYLPFGAGPRTCIARRFSQLEIKAALLQLVRNFRFEATADTKLTYIPATFDHVVPEEIFVRIVKREEVDG